MNLGRTNARKLYSPSAIKSLTRQSAKRWPERSSRAPSIATTLPRLHISPTRSFTTYPRLRSTLSTTDSALESLDPSLDFTPKPKDTSRTNDPQPNAMTNSNSHVSAEEKNHVDTSVHPAQHQTGTGTEGKHEWKQRAPYRVHESNDDFDVKLEGGCHCGLVKYQLSRDAPLASKLCHCTTCQTQHAAPFQWAAIFHKTDINFLSGHHNLEWYDPTEKSIEHSLPCKVRCHYCHSPIMDEGRNMILLFPSLIHFKEGEEGKQQKEKFRPKLHMFYNQRVMDIPDNLPKWAGINEQSEFLGGDTNETKYQTEG